MSNDYYAILGISKNASDVEIKRAYRKLAQQYHPDKQGGNSEKFKEINQAYQVLSDVQKRQQYDRFGTAFEQGGPGFGGFSGGPAYDFSDIFDFFSAGQKSQRSGWSDIFEGIFQGEDQGRHRDKGDDIVVDLEISLEEAAQGAEKELRLYKSLSCNRCQATGAEPNSDFEKCRICQGKGKTEIHQRAGFFSFNQVTQCLECRGQGKRPIKPCSRCGGDGRYKDNAAIKFQIPAGIDEGETLRLPRQGGAGIFGAMAGDLYATIHIKPHKLFKRQGSNLYYQQPISFTQAVLGDKIEVPTFDGAINLKIPAGTESGTIFKLRQKGMPARSSQADKGDLLIQIKIKTPKKLSRRAKKLIEELKGEI